MNLERFFRVFFWVTPALGLPSLGLSAPTVSTPPLFAAGTETFRLQDGAGKTPVYRILKDSMTKQALASVVNSMGQFPKSGSPDQPGVELQLEKVIFRPLKNTPDKVAMVVQISGREFELDPVLSKADLQKGKTIEIELPPRNEEMGVFSTTSRGRFALHYQRNQNVLVVERAFADFSFKSSFSSEESEHLKFMGKGLRE